MIEVVNGTCELCLPVKRVEREFNSGYVNVVATREATHTSRRSS